MSKLSLNQISISSVVYPEIYSFQTQLTMFDWIWLNLIEFDWNFYYGFYAVIVIDLPVDNRLESAAVVMLVDELLWMCWTVAASIRTRRYDTLSGHWSSEATSCGWPFLVSTRLKFNVTCLCPPSKTFASKLHPYCIIKTSTKRRL